MSSSQRLYRERIYIVKDIILKLVQYGKLSATALISFCGLNFKKHTPVLNKMELKGLITKSHISTGKRIITTYEPTQKGIEFCKHILEPYEIMFPRIESTAKHNLELVLILI